MSSDEVQSRLEGLGVWRPHFELELFEFLEDFAPAGAFDGVEAYLLVDKTYAPVRGAPTRDWRPVVKVGDELVVDVSPRIIDLVLEAIDYFGRPDHFDDEVVFQIHNLALDFYQGYRVRESALSWDGDILVIQGHLTWGISRGQRPIQFETRVGRGQPAVFAPMETNEAGW